MKTTSFVIAALFASVSAVQVSESPDCPDSSSVFSYNERVAAAAGLAQLKGEPIVGKPTEPGGPPYWQAYWDGPKPAPPPPEPRKELPLCRGGRSGDIPGQTCMRFVTSTAPGKHGNTLMQLNGPERGIEGIHDNAAHITTAAGVLPTCMGADSDVPEVNCTNRKAPICNGKGTNGIPNVSCTPPLPMCNGLPGTNGHPGVDCIAPPLPTCGTKYGGLPGRDCKIRYGSDLPAPAGAPSLIQRDDEVEMIQICNGYNMNQCMTKDQMKQKSEELVQLYSRQQIPTCTDRHTVNCQPVCSESQTTGCTESRTPTSYPLNTWDWRDRFEGTKTWDYSTANRPF